MKKRLLALLVLAAFALPVSAEVILTFGQNLRGDTIVATDDGTTTEITGTDIAVTVTEIEAGVITPFQALLDLDATSVGVANIGVLGVSERFDGTFSIESALCGAGNCLSGSFIGATFGFLDGASLTMSSAMPPSTLIFSSDIINDLITPRGMSFSFANVNPSVAVNGTTIRGFNSSVSGTFSAAAVPEPGPLALLGAGIFGLAFVLRRRK